MKTIYITPAGKTAAHHIDHYFQSAFKHFEPICGIIILTSADMQKPIEEGICAANYDFPTDVIGVKNPFSDVSDYYDILSTMLEKIANIAETYTGEPVRCVINCSGGTTKLTMWMFDLSNLVAKMMPTKSYFATFDPNKNRVVFTERPMLSNQTIEKILGENKDESPENPDPDKPTDPDQQTT